MAPKPIPLFSDFLSMKTQIPQGTGSQSQLPRWQRLTFIMDHAYFDLHKDQSL